MKRITLTSLIVAVAVTLLNLGGLGINHAAAAGSATFSLSPSSNTINVNTVFGVTIYENGADVNVVTADLTYDASKLEFVNIDASGSAFANSVSASGGGGSVGISRYTAPGTTVSGNQKVATVNFKATAGSGSANVTMAGSSKIASNGVDIWNHAPVGATYTLATPTPTPNPTPTPTPQPNAPKQAQANKPATTTSAQPGAVLAVDAQDSATMQLTPATPQADTRAAVEETQTAPKRSSNVFIYVALGLLALLVGAVIAVRKLAQKQPAPQAKKTTKSAGKPGKKAKK